MMKKTIATLLMLGMAVVAGAQNLMESSSWKNVRAHPAPLPVVGEIVPVHSALSRPSFWSVGVETLDRDYAVFSRFKQYVGETGVGYGRLQSGWAKTEKEKGKYDFAWLDEHVDGLLAEGVQPWMCLGYANPLYAKNGEGLIKGMILDGPVMDGWLNYVQATVRHFKGKISMWEIWNEPDSPTKSDLYPIYTNLFLKTAKVIREVDPKAKIAALASWSPDRDFIRQFLKLVAEAKGLKYVDYITIHAYWRVSETVLPAMQKLREDVDKYNPNIEILQGEAGCPAHLEYAPSVLCNIDWTETSQAKWDLRHMMNFYSIGVPYSVFTMVDLQYDWKLQSLGLIRMDLKKKPVYKRPKFYMVQHVTSVITPDITPVEGVTVNYSGNREMRCFGLAKDGQRIGCALWFGWNIPESSLERTLVNVNINGLRLKDPVYVDLLTGYVHDLSKVISKDENLPGDAFVLKGLPVWDSPVLIIEREAIAGVTGPRKK